MDDVEIRCQHPPGSRKCGENVVQFRQFPASVMDASLKRRSKSMPRLARNADFKKIWDSLLTFRKMPISGGGREYSYDEYLIRMYENLSMIPKSGHRFSEKIISNIS